MEFRKRIEHRHTNWIASAMKIFLNDEVHEMPRNDDVVWIASARLSSLKFYNSIGVSQ